MKSLIHKWAKKTKGKGKGTAGGSEDGSRETSSDSARVGQKKTMNGSPNTNIYPGMEARDFGKVWGVLCCALALPFEVQRNIAHRSWHLSRRCLHGQRTAVLRIDSVC